MKWTEIELRGAQPFQCAGERVGTLERQADPGRIDGLVAHFDSGAHVELPGAVDISEQLECPRVFIFEGAPRDTCLLLGGEKAYWLTSKGIVRGTFPLFRRFGEEEYWTTQVLDQGGGVVVIYEAGVLAIDDALEIGWHTPKLLNDCFVGVEGRALKFLRDHETEWFMRLQSGEASRH